MGNQIVGGWVNNRSAVTAVDVAPMEEVVLQFLLCNEIGSFAGVFHQHTDAPQLALL
ncbi:MAG: hypothetical protein JZU65_02165 [Chlorobium sp.]|nr:hypothetical protein [Chlorobium sp.]